MKRIVFLTFALWSAALAQDGRQVLESKPLHLGLAGLPEWEEFENSTPHGTKLELSFQSSHTQESTLLIRQRNVKVAWNVTLNGRKLGTLETLTQPLVRALAVPAGVLKPGENQLVIARGPSRLSDDTVVGETVLDPRHRPQARAQATV